MRANSHRILNSKEGFAIEILDLLSTNPIESACDDDGIDRSSSLDVSVT